MGRFGKFIDHVVTIFAIVVDMLYGLVIGLYSMAVLSSNMPAELQANWNAIGLSILAIIIFNGVQILIKCALRSFKQ